MIIYFNNEELNTSSQSVEAFILEQGLAAKGGIAIALNQSVIPRESWKETTLNENDRILVITATQGG